MDETSEYKFKRNIDIGDLDAESDRFLLTAFVQKDDLNFLLNSNDRKCIILGRTGSGKTGLIRYLENKKSATTVRIEPESLSISHLSNSDIVQYFTQLGIKLELFYKELWRHVFIIELIKMHFPEQDTFFRLIIEKVRGDAKKEQSLKYIKKWGDKFWKDTEYRINELESQFENQFKNSLGLESSSAFKHFQATGQIESSSSNLKRIKTEVMHKAQSVMDKNQSNELRNIIKMLKNDVFSKSNQKTYYLVIDDLDKDWVNQNIVYDLIKSLMEVLKELSSVPQTKIIIALRTNLLQKIFQENKSRGFQREKYQSLYLDLKWSKEELKTLVNNRLSELMRGTYTTETPTIDDILTPKKSTKKSEAAFQYLLDRTFYRPRDVIDFFNKAIECADGNTKISLKTLKNAEKKYSYGRIVALQDEWEENYGDIEHLYNFLKNVKPTMNLNTLIPLAEEYYNINHHLLSNIKQLDLKQNFEDYFNNELDITSLLKEILVCLYDIGIIGIKIQKRDKTRYSYEYDLPIFSTDLTADSFFSIHKMFYQALSIEYTRPQR